MSEPFDLEAFRAESRRLYRRQMRFAAAMVIFFFGHVALVVCAADFGFLPIVVDYVEVLGLIGIFLGLGLIFYLLSKPPFSTGEVKETLRNTFALMRGSTPGS